MRLTLIVGLLLAAIPFASTASVETAWQSAGNMQSARGGHTMTLLPNGLLLVAGGLIISGTGTEVLNSAELYDSEAGVWSTTAPMNSPRASHSATLLNDGTVLVAGGISRGQTAALVTLASTEIYDPVSNTWSSGPDMQQPRHDHTAVLLQNGEVLIAGSADAAADNAAVERYDPVAGAWLPAASMAAARVNHVTVLLEDGSVLVAGGFGVLETGSSAERYTPATNSWSDAGTMLSSRGLATATRLADGRVLVTGGAMNGPRLAATEFYDPADNSWTDAGLMSDARSFHMAAILPGGSVMVAGGQITGDPPQSLASVDIYSPVSNTWTKADSMIRRRYAGAMLLLPDASVLVTGGIDYDVEQIPTIFASAERFPPNQLPTVTRTPLQGLRLGSLRSATIPVAVSWDAADADGISSFTLRKQRNNGAFSGVTLPDPRARSIIQFLQPGGTHRYRVRATDGRGTESAQALGPVTTLEARQETHGSVAYTGTWNVQADPNAFGGGTKFAGRADARATVSFTGTSISWVTSRGGARGIAEVWLDGVVAARVDLYSPTARVRQIMFARNGLTNSVHTLQIRVLGQRNAASSATRVDVDVFVVLR